MEKNFYNVKNQKKERQRRRRHYRVLSKKKEKILDRGIIGEKWMKVEGNKEIKSNKDKEETT